jgi:transglutaminase-like putative cysteine protease
MHFSVTHRTAYRYSEPVFVEPHLIRLRPRCDGSQNLTAYQLQISPDPAGRSEYLDAEGNSVVQVWFDTAIRELQVSSQFQLETLRANPYDFLLPPPDQLTLHPAGSGAVADFAREIARNAGDQTMPFVEMLAQRLFREWQYVIREAGDAMTAEATLAARQGSCRDFAVLFSEACRAMGLRSRFVSGYEMSSAGSDHPYMHAWSEVYIPGGGWRGYDPSQGVAVGAGHIAVAAALDPADAAPVIGTYRGTAKSTMEVAIQMQLSS